MPLPPNDGNYCVDDPGDVALIYDMVVAAAGESGSPADGGFTFVVSSLPMCAGGAAHDKGGSTPGAGAGLSAPGSMISMPGSSQDFQDPLIDGDYVSAHEGAHQKGYEKPSSRDPAHFPLPGHIMYPLTGSKPDKAWCEVMFAAAGY